jgi:hypothetical protein
LNWIEDSGNAVDSLLSKQILIKSEPLLIDDNMVNFDSWDGKEDDN